MAVKHARTESSDLLGPRQTFPRRGLSLCPPLEWSQVDFGDGDPTHGVKFVSPDRHCTLACDVPPAKGEFRAHLDGYRIALGTMFANARLGDVKPVQIGTAAGVRFSLTYGDSSAPSASEHVLVPLGTRVVTLYAYGSQAALRRCRDTIEACIASLSLLAEDEFAGKKPTP